jgi:hypothetical protein
VPRHNWGWAGVHAEIIMRDGQSSKPLSAASIDGRRGAKQGTVHP